MSQFRGSVAVRFTTKKENLNEVVALYEAAGFFSIAVEEYSVDCVTLVFPPLAGGELERLIRVVPAELNAFGASVAAST